MDRPPESMPISEYPSCRLLQYESYKCQIACGKRHCIKLRVALATYYGDANEEAVPVKVIPARTIVVRQLGNSYYRQSLKSLRSADGVPLDPPSTLIANGERNHAIISVCHFIR
jgi:hypothetical protein